MKITLLTGKIYDIKDELGIDIKVVASRSLTRLILKIVLIRYKIMVLPSEPKYADAKKKSSSLYDPRLRFSLRELPGRDMWVLILRH